MRTDTELASALAGGDSTALADIYDRYADHLHNFCYGVCRNPEYAADATQQTFLLAFERIGQLRDPSRLKSWLFAIARNEVMKGFRDTSRTRPVDDDAILETSTSSDSVENEFEVSELQNLVWEAAAGLDERDRLLLELNVRSGLDGAELAAAVGVSADHGYVLVKRMRERVEKSLGALVVARQARTMCSDLERLLSDWDGTFSIPIRKRVSRHLTQCDECEERRRKLVSPVALYGAAPVLAAPLGLKDAILDAAGSVVQTAEASEYTWDEDGFPDPVQTNWFNEDYETEEISEKRLPSSRKRLRRFGFYMFIIGGAVAISAVLSTGGEGPVLVSEKLDESQSALAFQEENSNNLVTSPDIENFSTTTEVPVTTTTEVPVTTTTEVPATTTTEVPATTTTEVPATITTTTTTTTTTLPPVPVPQLLSVDPGSIDIFIMWAAPSPHPPGSYEVGLRVAGGDWTVTSPDCGSCEERRAHVFDDLSCNIEYAVAIRFSDDLGRKSEWDQKEELFVC